MQGLADGYFVIPYTLGNYLADDIHMGPIDVDHHPDFIECEAKVKARLDNLLNIQGRQSVDSFHRRLGSIMWDKCGMARNEAGLRQAIEEIRSLRAEFYQDLLVPNFREGMNLELDKAGRVADFLELGELMCVDALHRKESCGGHFREESQTEEGEALRDDDNFFYVGAWSYKTEGEWTLEKEPLIYEEVKPTQRSYK